MASKAADRQTADPGDPVARERRAPSPLHIPARGWWAALKRVYAETMRDNMMIIAAGCAFYALLALFPGITALVSLYGLAADPLVVQKQLESVKYTLPEAAFTIINDQATKVASGGHVALSWGAVLGLLFALYSASAGVKTLFTALTIAYEEQEKRGFFRFQAISILFTIGSVVGIIIGLAVIIGVPTVLKFLPLGPAANIAIKVVSWLILLSLVMFGLGVLYRFGPSRAPANWRWLSPGSVVATVLWAIASVAFSFYVANFASYNETYGALGGVIVLLMWLWISAFVVLLGAELNAELELATEKDSTTGPEQPMGKRGAYVADHTVEQPRPDDPDTAKA